MRGCVFSPTNSRLVLNGERLSCSSTRSHLLTGKIHFGESESRGPAVCTSEACCWRSDERPCGPCWGVAGLLLRWTCAHLRVPPSWPAHGRLILEKSFQTRTTPGSHRRGNGGQAASQQEKSGKGTSPTLGPVFLGVVT